MPGRDVFLCYAVGDRLTHTAPLAAALNRRGISCWIDEGQILPGRSITDAVNEGLAKSTYVLVLITERFLGDGYRQHELNAALAQEIRTGTTIVIPIVQIDHERFAARYPMLSDKLAVRWDDGPDSVADRIALLFPRVPAPEWKHEHPCEYVGPVWVRVLPDPANPNQRHQLTLRWGPYTKEFEFALPATGPSSFTHHKTKPDQVMLYASVRPAAVVTFGQGPAPDQPAVSIDDGWTR